MLEAKLSRLLKDEKENLKKFHRTEKFRDQLKGNKKGNSVKPGNLDGDKTGKKGSVHADENGLKRKYEEISSHDSHQGDPQQKMQRIGDADTNSVRAERAESIPPLTPYAPSEADADTKEDEEDHN